MGWRLGHHARVGNAMTMRFLVNQRISSSSTKIKLLFAWLDFMRTASPGGPGWTVPRSSNGTTGGEGDNIASYSDLGVYTASTARSWFVLRQPDGKREWLFFRNDTNANRWWIYYNKLANSSGGDEWNIPSGTWTGITDDDDGTIATNIVAHFGADDASPYGWFVFTYASGSLTNPRWGLTQIPMDVASDPDDLDPVAWYYNGGSYAWDYSTLCSWEPGTWVGYVGSCPPSSTGWRYSPALRLQSYGGVAVPNGVPQTVASKDITFPIPFIRRASGAYGYFKGVTSWMRWNGYPRGVGYTFDSKMRVSLGDVNVPWDGVSDMDLS
jgi:hypothetical protein